MDQAVVVVILELGGSHATDGETAAIEHVGVAGGIVVVVEFDGDRLICDTRTDREFVVVLGGRDPTVVANGLVGHRNMGNCGNLSGTNLDNGAEAVVFKIIAPDRIVELEIREGNAVRAVPVGVGI